MKHDSFCCSLWHLHCRSLAATAPQRHCATGPSPAPRAPLVGWAASETHATGEHPTPNTHPAETVLNPNAQHLPPAPHRRHHHHAATQPPACPPHATTGAIPDKGYGNTGSRLGGWRVEGGRGVVVVAGRGGRGQARRGGARREWGRCGCITHCHEVGCSAKPTSGHAKVYTHTKARRRRRKTTTTTTSTRAATHSTGTAAAGRRRRRHAWRVSVSVWYSIVPPTHAHTHAHAHTPAHRKR